MSWTNKNKFDEQAQGVLLFWRYIEHILVHMWGCALLTSAGGSGVLVGRMGLASVGHGMAVVVQLVHALVVVVSQHQANPLLLACCRETDDGGAHWCRYLLQGVS
jgi:hypothetical protein